MAWAAMLGSAAIGAYSSNKASKDAQSAMKQPQMSARGKWAQENLYNTIQRGIKGEGMIPSSQMGWGQRRLAYTKGFKEAMPELESQMGRFVQSGDVKVKEYARGTMAQTQDRLMTGLDEEEKMSPYLQQQEAMQLGYQALAGEKRMGLSLTQMGNEAAMRQAQMPTFAGEFGYGVGRAGGWMSAGQRYSQLMGGQQ